MRKAFVAKYLLAVGLLFSVGTLKAQVLSFDHGEIEFYTNTVLSDIEAITEEADVSFNLESGEVKVSVAINSFEFEYELMQEHFNEKHMESEQFPKATFEGKVASVIPKDFEKIDVDVVGELTMHGVSNNVKFKAEISKSGDFLVVKSKMPVAFKDYNIDEPSILTKSVAESVEVKSILYLK